jgi:hypothetical protein
MGSGRTIYFTDENMKYLISMAKDGSRLSPIVNSIIDQERSRDSILSQDTLELISDYSNRMAISGQVVKVSDLVNKAVRQYLAQLSIIGNLRSNTGYEEKSNE